MDITIRATAVFHPAQQIIPISSTGLAQNDTIPHNFPLIDNLLIARITVHTHTGAADDLGDRLCQDHLLDTK